MSEFDKSRGGYVPGIAEVDFGSAGAENAPPSNPSSEVEFAMPRGSLARGVAESLIRMQGDFAAKQTEALEQHRQEVTRALADMKVEQAADGYDQANVIHGGGDGAAFSARYRNDTARHVSSNPRYQPAASPGTTHQFEYINKSSPFDPVATAANGVSTFWEDSLWSFVPESDTVEIEE